MKTSFLTNLSKPAFSPIKVNVCTTYISRFFGLMFQKSILPEDGIILVGSTENIMDASIHMFFMNFDIAVIWMNSRLEVVDKTVARRWRPFYRPSSSAMYILEAHPDRFNDFQIGDMLNY
jgi:uncharacterized membrane protein (UPF0127 family)